ncbi:MAG: hypothetical protein ACR2ME_11280 [Acidimicrobiia bacterium]
MTTAPTAPSAFIAADGSGDGSTATNPADLTQLDALIEQAGPGAIIELAAGAYDVDRPVVLSNGGAPGSPVTIRGPAEGPAPVLQGTRADPYDPLAEPGKPLFRLNAGADHLAFVGLTCQDVGNGCFLVAAPISDLAISEITASNVRRFFENAAGDGEPDATISGLKISNVVVNGFSKGAIRLGYETHDVTIVDVRGDSLQHDGDDFAIGVHLVDNVHDVWIERVTMDNAHDTIHDYWNGDGFAAESGVYNLSLIETSASGNTDAGYDLKASEVLLVNATAADNKRNFRLWGSNMVLEGCRGTNPNLRGGTGTQVQVQVLEAATVQLRDCIFVDNDRETIVFQVDGQAQLTVRSSQVERADSALLSLVAASATLELLETVEVTN